MRQPLRVARAVSAAQHEHFHHTAMNWLSVGYFWSPASPTDLAATDGVDLLGIYLIGLVPRDHCVEGSGAAKREHCHRRALRHHDFVGDVAAAMFVVEVQPLLPILDICANEHKEVMHVRFRLDVVN